MRKIAAILIGLLAVDRPSRDFVRQFPDCAENESGTRLMATAARLGDGLHSDADTIRTLRAQVISNPPPVWALQSGDVLEPPMPPLAVHVRLFRLLRADAIEQHECGNDGAAWADLHAVWILSRSLWNRPEAWSIAIAATGTRIEMTVAPKITPPIPAWWTEVATFDVKQPLMRSLEYEAWAMRERADRYPMGDSDGWSLAAAPFVRPFRLVEASITAGRLRGMAAAVEKCQTDALPSSDWTPFVRRVMSLSCVTK